MVRGTGRQHSGEPRRASWQVYVVLGRRATLRVEGDEHEVRAGSVVSVDRERDHSFQDITEDLRVLVVFAPPDTPET
jgi:quercetin dioxygenase-like cupin family protein